VDGNNGIPVITELTYAGTPYRVMGKSVTEVQQEIDDILLRRTAGWLDVVDEHGTLAPNRILITAGVAVSITALPTESANSRFCRASALLAFRPPDNAWRGGAGPRSTWAS
jgi:hypothetical protein